MVVALSEGLDRIEAQESLQCKPDPDLEHDPVSDLRRRPFVLFVVARNSDFVARRSVHGHVYTRHISRSSKPVSGSGSKDLNPQHPRNHAFSASAGARRRAVSAQATLVAVDGAVEVLAARGRRTPIAASPSPTSNPVPGSGTGTISWKFHHPGDE